MGPRPFASVNRGGLFFLPKNADAKAGLCTRFTAFLETNKGLAFPSSLVVANSGRGAICREKGKSCSSKNKKRAKAYGTKALLGEEGCWSDSGIQRIDRKKRRICASF